MMEGWDEIKLNKIAQIYSGFAFKSKEMTDNSNKGIPLVKIKNIFDRKVSYKFDSYLRNEFLLEKHEKYKLLKGDVLIAMTGQGSVGRIGKMHNVAQDIYVNQRVGIVRIDEDLADKEFIYQQMANSHNESVYFNLAMGAGQPNLSPKDIGNLKINLPPLPTQRKIATILSAYDDAIENNLKRIKLLEEKAQLTYEEWFVRMKFPGHETTPIDEETGLPEGWEKVRIGEICDVSGGGTPSKSVDEYWNNGDITWFSPTDLSKSNSLIQLDSSSKITELGLIKSSAKLLKSNSFMMTSRATIGLFGIIEKPFSTNQGFINVTPKNITEKEYLLYNFKYNLPLFINYATGATFLEIGKSSFKKIEILWPERKVIEMYHVATNTIHKHIFSLSKQNQLLKEARDILLPRLMTGMIDVDELQLSEHDF